VLAPQAPSGRGTATGQGPGLFARDPGREDHSPTDPCKETTISVKGEVIDLWYSGKVWARCTGRWRTLQLTASRSEIGDIAPAALVLTHFEYGYIT
jgi:hypothetical protein